MSDNENPNDVIAQSYNEVGLEKKVALFPCHHFCFAFSTEGNVASIGFRRDFI